MSPEGTAMSREGHRKLQAEMAELEAKAPALRRAVGEAREQGDLSENAAYHAAREDLAKLEAKVARLRGQLQGAVIIDREKSAAAGTVVFGSMVRVRDLDSGREETYHLVGPGEVDVLENKIPTASPVGRALLTHAVGDEVEIEVPKGRLRYRIAEIG